MLVGGFAEFEVCVGLCVNNTLLFRGGLGQLLLDLISQLPTPFILTGDLNAHNVM